MKKKARKQQSKGFAPPADSANPTPQEFASMVEAHDPTYVWSRDEGERLRGQEQRDIIDMARDRLGDLVAVPLWNRAMHKKVVPAMLDEFLWRMRRPAATA